MLVPNSTITYQRPSTIGSTLLNYRNISQNLSRPRNHTSTKKCGSCGLCGNYGKLKDMVWDNNKFRDNKNKEYKCRHYLNCKDYGIYAGQCVFCFSFYVGQTKNSFATRWNAHRGMWNKMKKYQNVVDNISDNQALFLHYKKMHPDKLTEGLQLSDAFRVIFLEKPPMEMLDIREDFWITRLNAKINIKKSILPHFKSSCPEL